MTTSECVENPFYCGVMLLENLALTFLSEIIELYICFNIFLVMHHMLDHKRQQTMDQLLTQMSFGLQEMLFMMNASATRFSLELARVININIHSIVLKKVNTKEKIFKI